MTCFFHMDHVLVHSSAEKGHLKHPWMTFEKIRGGLKLKLSKYVFFKKHLKYLAHLFSGERMFPLKEKIVSRVEPDPPMDCNKDKTYSRFNLLLEKSYRKFH